MISLNGIATTLDALKSLKPGAEWSIVGGTEIIWHDTEQTEPTQSEIDVAMTRPPESRVVPAPTSLTATAGTAKGGVIDAFGKAETPEVPGGTFGVGNTSDGTSATTDLGGGFGNA